MSYTFHAQRDNAAGTLLYPFSPGDPTLRLNSGQGSPFGPVSSTTPIRVTVYHPASLVGGAVVDPTMTATFNVVSLSGDNLGGLTFQRGNVSLVFPAGSTVARVITQDDFAEIQGAVNDLAESGTAGVSISSPNGTLAVGGTASLPTLDVLAVPQSAVTGLTAALAGKLATNGNGSGLTGITQSQVSGVRTTDAPTFAGATLTDNVIATGVGIYLRNNSGSLYLGASDDCRLYRVAANYLGTTGSLSVGSSAAAGVGLAVAASNSGHVGVIVKGAASQSANLQEWRDSSGTGLAWVLPTGQWYSPSDGVGAQYGRYEINGPTNAGMISSVSNDFYCYAPGSHTLHMETGGGDIVLGAFSSPKTTIYGKAAFGSSTANAQAHVTAGGSSVKGLIVQGAASQTANLTEWQDSSGTALSSVDKNGYICVPTGSGAPATNPTSGGGLYYDTTGNALYAWNGSAWKSVNLT